MEVFDARSEDNVRWRGRKVVGLLGLFGLLLGPAVVVGAGAAGAAGPGSVSGVSVSLSTNAVGATEVDYTVGFTTSSTGALDPNNNGTITISASGSTAFPSNCGYTVTDVTTSQSTTTCSESPPGSTVTISSGISINAGDSVKVGAVQVGNASASGSKTLTVSTSSDLAASTTFSLVAASPVTGVSVSLSTAAAGATEVDYTAGFTASATGTLDPNNGTITLSASGSTAFASNCGYTVTDVTTGQSTTTCPTTAAGSSVTISAGINIHHGDSVKVAATEVGNASASGSKTLTVSTSSDLAASTTFSLVAASPVTGVSVSLSTAAAGANEVDYTVGFTTSATGALDSNNGTITLSTSGSTAFASNCSYTVTDVTTGLSTTTCPTGVSGSSVTITPEVSIHHGDSVQVGATEVGNAPSVGSQTLTVSTSSDLASSTTFSLVTASPVTGVSVALSTAAAGATQVDYTAGFTTSATGALDSNNGTITLSTSGSTAFASNCSYTVTDVTTSQSTTTCPAAVSGSSVTLEVGGLAIRSGDTVHVTAGEVGNATSTGSQTFTVSTSSDLSAGTTFSLVAASKVSGVSVKLSKTRVSALAKYTVAFTTSATGALDPNNGTITQVGPSGTVFPSNCSYTITDVTTSQSTTTCPTAVSGSSATISTGGLSIRAGDKVSVVSAQVKNAKTTGAKTLKVSTSSDLAGKGKFTLT